MVKTCKHTPWFPVKISLNHQSNDESKLLWLMFGKGLMVKETFFLLSSTHGLPSPDHFPMIKSSFLAGEIQIQLAILAGEISIFQECLMVKSWLNRMFSQFFGVVKCQIFLSKTHSVGISPSPEAQSWFSSPSWRLPISDSLDGEKWWPQSLDAEKVKNYVKMLNLSRFVTRILLFDILSCGGFYGEKVQ